MEERVWECETGKAERVSDALQLHGLGESFQGAVHGEGFV